MDNELMTMDVELMSMDDGHEHGQLTLSLVSRLVFTTAWSEGMRPLDHTPLREEGLSECESRLGYRLC